MSNQEPAYVHESEIPLSSKDHSCPQDVELFAYNGLEPHTSTSVGSQVHQDLKAPEGGGGTSLECPQHHMLGVF